MKWIEFYNENKQQECGSDWTWAYDQRLKASTAMARATKIAPKRAKFLRIIEGTSLLDTGRPITYGYTRITDLTHTYRHE